MRVPLCLPKGISRVTSSCSDSESKARVLRKQRLARLVVKILLEGEALLERFGALGGGMGVDGVEVALDVGEGNPGGIAHQARQHACPAPHRHVDEGVGVTHHPLAIRQAVVDDAPVPLGLEGVAVDGVGLGLGREQLEVHRLAAIGADAGGHEHQPRVHVGAQRRRVGGQELAGLLGQVQQDGVAVEHRGIAIHQRRRLGVGVDGQEGRVVLLALARVDGHQLVRQARLLQVEGDFEGVGRGVEVEGEHGGILDIGILNTAQAI